MRAAALVLACILVTPLLAAPADERALADPDWHIPLAPADSGTPTHPDYVRLAGALTRYQALAAAGGWPELLPGTVLTPGQRDPQVVTLRERLRVSGDFTGVSGTADVWFFDAGLQHALQDFQARHGLPATGVLDERTLKAANVPAAARVRQLEVTLERWRWLPRNLGERYLWANAAGGTLDAVENGATVLSMRIIAGHPDRQTPSFQDTVRQIVVNPSWSVPRRIAVEDLLPWQLEDPTFLDRLGIRVYRADDRWGKPVPPTAVRWSALSADKFPYQLRQDPGPLNSLGRLKFVLDNPWDIYLHDTPSRRLFDLNSRTLSSGCLRLEKPEELARLLLGDEAPVGAPSGAIREGGIAPEGAPTGATTGASTTKTLAVPRPMPIYVVYLTSWVTPEGVVNFRPDVYGRDARLR